MAMFSEAYQFKTRLLWLDKWSWNRECIDSDKPSICIHATEHWEWTDFSRFVIKIRSLCCEAYGILCIESLLS